MRHIKYIVLHCTATPQTTTVESILRYWREDLGWKNPGYHHLIDPQGKVYDLQPIEKPSNGVKGYNQNSIHISYIGGVDAEGRAIDNRTPEQICEMLNLVCVYHDRFPEAIIQGHRDFPGVAKECPSFDVRSWIEYVGVKNRS